MLVIVHGVFVVSLINKRKKIIIMLRHETREALNLLIELRGVMLCLVVSVLLIVMVAMVGFFALMVEYGWIHPLGY